MRVLICGGREFDDWHQFITAMDGISSDRGFSMNQPIYIIEGGAKGADFCARLYAKYCGWDHEPYPAEWNKYGKAAGGIRNQQMLDEGRPDLVVAFPGGSGTADMVRRAKAAGVEVIEVE
jgi:UDP-N-acetylmuramoylalanine-D-glutamate ligase